MGRLVRADDHSVAIVGTLEVLHGCALIAQASPGEDGEFEIQWAGGTEIYWDDQKTALGVNAQRIFVDEDGESVLEFQVHLVEG